MLEAEHCGVSLSIFKSSSALWWTIRTRLDCIDQRAVITNMSLGSSGGDIMQWQNSHSRLQLLFWNFWKKGDEKWSRGHAGWPQMVHWYMHMMCTQSFTELLSGRQTDRNSRGRTPPPHTHTPPAPLMREEKSLCRGRTLDVNYWTKSNRITSRFSLHRETLKKEIQGHSRKQIPVCLEMQSSFCLMKPYASLTSLLPPKTRTILCGSSVF